MWLKDILMNKSQDWDNQEEVVTSAAEPTPTPSTSSDKDNINISRYEYNLIMKTLSELQQWQKAVVTTQQKLHTWPNTYCFKIIDWKVVTKIKMIRNKVVKNLMTRWWIEEQDIEVTYNDGSTEKMLYWDFVNSFTWSQQITPKKVINNVYVTFKDGRPPETLSDADFKKYYYTRVEDVSDKVIDWTIINSITTDDQYIFETEEFWTFTVDQSAIN